MYRYAFWVLDHYILLSFDLYHVSIVHMHVRALLSDDESVVSVTRKEQQLEQTCLTICFCCCFVLLWFYFAFIFACLLLNHYLHVWWVFFRFGHCIAFPSIYGFRSPLWYLQTFLIAIMSFYSDIIKFINKHYTVSRSIHNINN